MSTPRLELAGVAVLTLAGALPRLLALDSIPPGLHGDEAWTGLEALRVLREGGIGVWSPSAFGQPAGPFYWTAAVLLFLEPTVAGVRASIALLGVLTIPASFLLYRVLLGPRIAFLGAILLAFSFWHIHYSRIAFPTAALPLVEVVAFAALFLALKRDRPVLFLIAGGLLGLGLYTYIPYPFTAAGVAVFLAIWAVSAVVSGQRPINVVTRLSAVALGGLLVSGPLLLFLATQPEYITGYAQVTLIPFQEGTLFQKTSLLGERAIQVIGAFFFGREVDYTDGLGGQPLLDPLTRAAFLIGLVIALRNARHDSRYLFALLVLAFSLLPAILTSTNWGESRRIIGALPMVYFLAATGLSWAIALLAPRLRRVRPTLAIGGVAAILLVTSALINLQSYFIDYAAADTTRWVYAEELTHACAWLGQRETPTQTYFYSGRWSYRYETCRLLAPDLAATDRSLEFGDYTLEKEMPGPALYLFLPPYLDDASRVAEMYPEGTRIEGRAASRLLFVAYEVN